ncbi:MAG: hypothetical protein ACTSVK_08610 [Promethearchaeota archaeon]
MKRFASVDFLRGIAIVMMIILHIISDTLDINTLTSNLSVLPLIQILLLVVLPFLGGLAGFFLMVSSTGNMFSMQHQLAKGMGPKTLVLRQIMGGFLLLIVAMLSEAIIGYHGTVGEFFLHLNDPSKGIYNQALWRFLHFETVNTIAWCIILNGIIHAILTKNGKWKNANYLIKSYFILAIVVLVFTPLMWFFADKMVPGYPYAKDPKTGIILLYAYLGKSSFSDVVIRFFLGPLAASWEPVFPYLAASFLGSIIGVYISQDPSEIKTPFLKKYMIVGLIMFVIGAVGVILNVVLVIINSGLDEGLSLYILISEHRYWTILHGVPILGWFFQFLFLNGFSICAILLIIRLVEFRGLSKKFAEKTVFIRRMGFIAFTIYTAQYIYNLIFFIVSSIFSTPYTRLNWGGTILVIIFSLLVFYLITLGWEKIGYIGSLEWMIATIAAYIIPGKKKPAKMKWWQKGRLNVEGAFYNAEWIDIISIEDLKSRNQSESLLSYKLGILGFFFFPLSLVAYNSAKKAQQSENTNNLNKKGKILGLVGIIFFFAWGIMFSTLKLSNFGISL